MKVQNELDGALIACVFKIETSVLNMQAITFIKHVQERLLQYADTNERATATILERFRDNDAKLAELMHHVQLNATHDGTVCITCITLSYT